MTRIVNDIETGQAQFLVEAGAGDLLAIEHYYLDAVLPLVI
jgi:hypothetical protein